MPLFFRLLCELFGCPRASLKLSFTAGTIRISGEHLMARITTDQTIVVSVQPLNAAGEPANIDGNATFTESSGFGSFEQLSPTSARFTPNGTPGATQIKVTADADLDEGETRTLEASGALEIILPEQEATRLEVTFGEPENA